MESIVSLLDKDLERSLASEKRYDEVLELIHTITASGKNEPTNVYQPIPFSNEIDANLPQVALIKTQIKQCPDKFLCLIGDGYFVEKNAEETVALINRRKEDLQKTIKQIQATKEMYTHSQNAEQHSGTHVDEDGFLHIEEFENEEEQENVVHEITQIENKENLKIEKENDVCNHLESIEKEEEIKKKQNDDKIKKLADEIERIFYNGFTEREYIIERLIHRKEISLEKNKKEKYKNENEEDDEEKNEEDEEDEGFYAELKKQLKKKKEKEAKKKKEAKKTNKKVRFNDIPKTRPVLTEVTERETERNSSDDMRDFLSGIGCPSSAHFASNEIDAIGEGLVKLDIDEDGKLIQCPMDPIQASILAKKLKNCAKTNPKQRSDLSISETIDDSDTIKEKDEQEHEHDDESALEQNEFSTGNWDILERKETEEEEEEEEDPIFGIVEKKDEKEKEKEQSQSQPQPQPQKKKMSLFMQSRMK